MKWDYIKNPAQEIKNYFCLGFLCIPRKTKKASLKRAYSFRVQPGKIAMCIQFSWINLFPIITKWIGWNIVQCGWLLWKSIIVIFMSEPSGFLLFFRRTVVQRYGGNFVVPQIVQPMKALLGNVDYSAVLWVVKMLAKELFTRQCARKLEKSKWSRL